MEWSPQAAMKAYLQTLHLSKLYNNNGSSEVIEPKSMEFISALAAGKKAKLMVEITTQCITSLTIALAVAAKQTGSRFICILPHANDDGLLKSDNNKKLISDLDGLEEVIEFVYGDPFEVLLGFKNIDFAVVDCRIEDNMELLRLINGNPKGCIVVLHNLRHRVQQRRDGDLCEQAVKRKKGVKYVTLPIGEGIELTRIRPIVDSNNNNNRESRRFRRFHVTYENL